MTWQEQLSIASAEGYQHGSWQQRHYAIRSTGGHPVAILLDAVTIAIERPKRRGAKGSPSSGREITWPDANATAGYGQVLDGILQLLNENLDGMDGGTLWIEVAALAETIGWDLDTSQVIWDESDV